MKAALYQGAGGPEILQIVEDQPKPLPRENEVLIAVEAFGLNRPEVLQREGKYPPPPGASPLLGLEAAGRIAALGRNCLRFAVGDEVVALCNGGAYAGFVAVPQGQVLPKPRTLSWESAAALPETFFTVWSNLFMRAGLKQGESLLIHGGASGIGTTAIQLAKAFGAKPYVTVGSAKKAEACLKLGAIAAINYKQEDFVERLLELRMGQGVDLVLDMVCGDYIPRNIKVLREEGRLVVIAFQRGIKAEVNFAVLASKRLTVLATTLRPQSPEAKAAIARELEACVWPLLEKGEVAPVIHKVYPFAELEKAHRDFDEGRHIGKLVVRMGSPGNNKAR